MGSIKNFIDAMTATLIVVPVFLLLFGFGNGKIAELFFTPLGFLMTLVLAFLEVTWIRFKQKPNKLKPLNT